MKRLLLLLTAAMGFLACVPAAHAQEKFPSRTIKIIVAFAPGSATDVTARLLAEAMRPVVGQSVIVENKPGAFGILAIEEMARSKPDGHTLMIGNVSTSALTPRLYRKRFSIDPDKDIVPVSRISQMPAFFIVSTKHMPAKTIGEFIAYAKERPGKIRYATSGVGSFPHYDGEIFQRRAGIKMDHIPMKEGPPAMVKDILSGDLHIAAMTMATAAGLVKAGELRPLVVWDQRVPDYPDVPSMADAGFPGVGTPLWSMMFAPAATPKPLLDALHEAVTKALNSDQLKEGYKKQLVTPTTSASVDDAKKWLAKEMEKWDRVMSEVKIELE
jgi:tripartite-type tricarboxylate transporter receptor subunit TctC